MTGQTGTDPVTKPPIDWMHVLISVLIAGINAAMILMIAAKGDHFWTLACVAVFDFFAIIVVALKAYK